MVLLLLLLMWMYQMLINNKDGDRLVQLQFNGHTFGIPILDYPMGTLGGSSTNGKYSGSEMRASDTRENTNKRE